MKIIFPQHVSPYTSASPFIGTKILSGFLQLFRSKNFKSDENKIVAFLVSSKVLYRSTNAMVDGLRLPKNRIQEICKDSRKIVRGQFAKETWRLSL